MPILPEQFGHHSALELLRELEQGMIGFDHRLIQRLLANPEEASEALATVAAAPADDRLLDLNEQIFDLFRQLKTPEAVDFYIERINSRDGAEIPDELIEALADVGEAAVEPLLALHEETKADSTDIVFVLSALGKRDPRITALIEQTLQADPYEGALCAGLYGSPELTGALEARLATLAEDQEHDRKAIQDALDTIASPSEETARETPDIYALYPETASPVFEALPESVAVEFLSSESAEYRTDAALSFLDSNYGEDARDELFRVAQSDETPEARGAAMAALGEKIDDAEVSQLLYAVLGREGLTTPERAGVLIGLSAEAGKPEVERAVLAAYDEPEMRAVALEAMYRSVDPRFAEKFPVNLQHEDSLVRRHAIRGVGVFAIESCAIELVPFFQDEELREDALYAYALAMPGKTTEKGVHRLFEEIEQKADALSPSESEAVGMALDQRLVREGLDPVFFPDEHNHNHEPVEQLRSDKIGRNDPCPCGSGKKYKKCCGAAL